MVETHILPAVDLRGHGASDWPGRYGITLMAEDIAVALPRLASCVDGVLDVDWAVVEQVRPEIDDPDPTWPQTLARPRLPITARGD